MRKTLLAAFISASVFALPAFAQVSLSGAGHLGGGVTGGAGGALNGAMRGPAQLGAPTPPGLQQTRHHVRHTVDKTTGDAHSTLERHGKVHADTDASGAARADAGDTHAHANAGVDADADVNSAAAADRASGSARGVGDQVSDTAHSAINSTERSAGTVGDAVHRSATESSVGADTKVRAKADAHGH